MAHASRASRSMAPFPAPWEFVTAEGIVEVVANEQEIVGWSKARKLGSDNVRHHLQFFDGNGESHHVGGRIVRQKLQWLKRMNRSEYVPVLGGSDLFMKNIVARRQTIDMPFTKKKLNEHLAHARKHGPACRGHLSDYKWQVVGAPSDMDFWISRAFDPKTQPEPQLPEAMHQPDLPDYGALFQYPPLVSVSSSSGATAAVAAGGMDASGALGTTATSQVRLQTALPRSQSRTPECMLAVPAICLPPSAPLRFRISLLSGRCRCRCRRHGRARDACGDCCAAGTLHERPRTLRISNLEPARLLPVSACTERF